MNTKRKQKQKKQKGPEFKASQMYLMGLIGSLAGGILISLDVPSFLFLIFILAVLILFCKYHERKENER